MNFFIEFGRFLDGKSMEIDHFWSIFGHFSRIAEMRSKIDQKWSIFKNRFPRFWGSNWWAAP